MRSRSRTLRLLVRREASVSVRVHAGRKVRAVSLARLEPVSVVARLVPRAALDVVDVLAPLPRVRVRRGAESDAEFAVRDLVVREGQWQAKRKGGKIWNKGKNRERQRQSP